MNPELEGIVQRMLDAGESEENIATVIQGYQPTDPREQRKAEGMRQVFGTNAMDVMEGRKPMGSIGDIAKDMAVQGAIGAVLQGGAGLLSKLPMGRLLTSGMAGAKAAAQKLPIVGPPMKAGAQAAMESWRATAPAVAAEVPAAMPAVAGPKPKLSAAELAAKMREMYGSEKAGRMLYGQARPGVSAATRTDSIKRLTPQIQSTLPKAAQNAINKELASSTAEEAFQYAGKAPNQQAKDYFGELLRRTLIERSGR